jgi:shikimate kinase
MGEVYFRQLEVQTINDVVDGRPQSHRIVATGGGLPCIEGMMQRLRGLGSVVYLSASMGELWNRLTVDPQALQLRPLLWKSGRAGLERLIKIREPIYQMATITLHTDGLDIDQVVDALIRVLGER